MNCRDLEHHAIEYLDGALSGALRSEVELHLSDCADCRVRLDGFAEIDHLLEEWEPVAPSAGFDARLEAKIREQKAGFSGWLAGVFGGASFAPPVWAGALAAVLLVAVSVVRFAPQQAGTSAAFEDPITELAAAETNEELILYRDLPVLENLDLLSNFEILQELDNPTP